MDQTDRTTDKPDGQKALYSQRTKNAIIFLFFLFMSCAYWVVQKLEESIAVRVTVPVMLTNVPKDVIITTDLPKQIQVTVRDKGNELMTLFWNPRLDTIRVDFREHDTHDVTANVALGPSVIQQILKEKLPPRSTITQMSSDTLFYAYNRGIHRKLPVRLRGSITTDAQYNLDSYTFTPDSVDVYAPAKILDTLNAAYTELTILEGLTESRTMALPVNRSRGMRFFPDTVSLSVNVDILTRNTIEIYIQGINFPEGKELRTLPATVSLTYLVSAAQAKSVNTDLFQVAVSYDDIKDSPHAKCKPHIISMPGAVSSAFITPQQVDFFIEDITTSVQPVRP